MFIQIDNVSTKLSFAPCKGPFQGGNENDDQQAETGSPWTAGTISGRDAWVFGPAHADDLSGDLVIMQWQGGVDAEMWGKLEAAFTAEHPGVTVKELNTSGQGDVRGLMRTALMSGEVVDIIINTWPAFRAELVASGTLRPLDDQWAAMGWDKRLNQSWRDLGTTDGKTYGISYTYGDRSGIWYKPSTLAKAGLSAAPTDWAGFLASFKALSDAGIAEPIAMPGKYWAHAEWFETLLARTAGVEFMAKLARHEAKWTDPEVKTALMKYRRNGCRLTAAAMQPACWPMTGTAAAGQVFSDKAGYLLMGMWVNATAKGDYKLDRGYGLFLFSSSRPWAWAMTIPPSSMQRNLT